MLFYFLKFYFIYISTRYILFKTLTQNHSSIKHRLLSDFSYIILAFCASFLKLNIPELTYIVPLLFIWFSLNFRHPNPRTNFIATIISFSISLGLLTISSATILLILTPFYYSNDSFPKALLALLAGIVQYILSIMLFQAKRLRNGMPFLQSTTFLNIGMLLSLLLITFLIYIPSQNKFLWARAITPLFFIAIIFFLIHWWQAQITKSYKQALINRELESLRMELIEKEKQLAELSARNEELGRLIHKDNKRIPAMEHAVSEFLIMDLDNKETVIERGNALLMEIQKLSTDRNAVVTEIYARKYKHHDTGVPELDTMLNYMEKRAYGEHIKLSIQTAVNLRDLVSNTISAEDLSHVLSDLLENAIIATKGHAAPIIQLQFYRTGKDFILEIADNGTPFEATSLINFGLEQITTHADTGGSGIGLMDIWKVKGKYSASLHISEYDTNAPYTKKIALIFNKKNRYTISTSRKEELSTLCKRTDLQIF